MRPLHLLAALGIVAIWGFNFVVIRLGLNHLPPLLLCALRFTLAALPAVFFVRRPDLPLRHVAAYGLVMFGLQFALLFSGIGLGVSPGLASLAVQLQSFMTIGLAAFLLKERPSRFQLLGAALAFCGIVVVASHLGQDVTALGLGVVILSAATWAAGNLLAKRMGRVNVFALVVWGSLAAAGPMLALSLALEGPARIAGSLSLLRWDTVAAIAYLVYCSTLLGFAVWNWLLSRYPAASVAPLTLMVPLFGMGSSSLVLGEALQPWKLLAFALVILGLGINLFGARLSAGLARARQ